MASSDPARSAFLAARDVNLLSDPDRFKRRRALDSVTKELFEGQNVRAAVAHRARRSGGTAAGVP